jgi:hypothetical protein
MVMNWAPPLQGQRQQLKRIHLSRSRQYDLGYHGEKGIGSHQGPWYTKTAFRPGEDSTLAEK